MNQNVIAATFVARDEVTKTVSGIRGSIKGLSGDLKKSFGGGLGLGVGFGLVGMASAAGAAIGDFVTDSIHNASALNETLNKSKVIFGQNADEIESWGQTAATTFGQSKRQAIDTATSFAGLFQTVGVAAEESADWAKKLTVLGSDLASFFDTDVQTALDAVRSGLSGESEPLRKFNVFLSETAVQAKATAMGLKPVNGRLSEQQKIMARYQIIMEQTAVAQGDFARTSDSLANSQRENAAAAEDVSARLGEKLLPIQLKINQAFLGGAEALTVFFDTLDNRLEGKTQLEEAKQTFLGGFPSKAEVEAQLQELLKVPEELATKHGVGEHSPFQELLFNLDINGVQTDWKNSIDQLNNYLATQAFDETGRAVVQAGGEEVLAQYMDFLENRAPHMIQSPWAKMPQSAYDAFTNSDVWDKMHQAAVKTSLEVAQGFQAGQPSAKDIWKQYVQDMKNALDPAKEIAFIQAKLSGQKIAEGLNSSNPLVRAQTAQMVVDYQHRLDDLQGISSTIGSTSGDELIAALGGTPLGPVTGFVNEVNTKLDNIDTDIHFSYSFERFRLPNGADVFTGAGGHRTRGARAAGGPVDAGGTYLVGERGPELLSMGRSGYVTPNHALGSGTIVVEVDGHELFRLVDERMGKRMAMSSGSAYTRS